MLLLAAVLCAQILPNQVTRVLDRPLRKPDVVAHQLRQACASRSSTTSSSTDWFGAHLDLAGANGIGLFYLAMRKGLDYLDAHPDVDLARPGVTGLSPAADGRPSS